MNVQMALDVKLYSCFNLGAKCGVVVNPMPRLLYPNERHYSDTDWTVVENLSPHWG
jgi:hypothetical protein